MDPKSSSSSSTVPLYGNSQPLDFHSEKPKGASSRPHIVMAPNIGRDCSLSAAGSSVSQTHPGWMVLHGLSAASLSRKRVHSVGGGQNAESYIPQPKEAKSSSHRFISKEDTDVVAKVVLATGLVSLSMKQAAFSMALDKIQALDKSIGSGWRCLKKWACTNLFSPIHKRQLYALSGQEKACRWVVRNSLVSEGICQSSSEGHTQETYLQACSYAHHYLGESSNHPPEEQKKKLNKALEHLDWVMKSGNIGLKLRFKWIEAYTAISKTLAKYDGVGEHPLARSCRQVVQVIAAIDERMAQQKGCSVDPALECLQQTLHRVRDEGFSKDSLLVLACAACHVSLKYMNPENFPAGEGSLKEKHMNVYIYPALLLFFGMPGLDIKNIGVTLTSVGRIRIPIDKFVSTLRGLVDKYQEVHVGDEGKRKIHGGLTKGCCVIPVNKFFEALIKIDEGVFDDAHTHLKDFLDSTKKDRPEYEIICAAVAWLYIRAGSGYFQYARPFLDQIEIKANSIKSFQRLFLETKMGSLYTSMLDIPIRGLDPVEQFFAKHDMEWLRNHSQGVTHEYPSTVVLSGMAATDSDSG